MTTQDSPRWGFIGAGKMATALALGLVRSGCLDPSRLAASDPSPAACEALARLTGGTIAASNTEVARSSDVLVLAVKPQVIDQVLAELRPGISGKHLVLSVAAGVTLERLEAGLGATCRLVRAMPNTPALVNTGASAYCTNARATADDERLVKNCLDAVGISFQVPESLLDAVTGLSGSGPAFVYQVIEALSDGGVRAGLPRSIASALAAQTVMGAARMVLETGQHPAQLKDEVASPGGTTIAGLHALEKGGLRAALIDAVAAAARRSAELGALAPPPPSKEPR